MTDEPMTIINQTGLGVEEIGPEARPVDQLIIYHKNVFN